MRRLSFDLAGDGINKARRQTKKQENQSHRPSSGKQNCSVEIKHKNTELLKYLLGIISIIV